LHVGLVTHTHLPPGRELDEAFLWLKGKWSEGGGFIFLLMTVFQYNVSLMFHYSSSNADRNLPIVVKLSPQPSIPLCHPQVHAYSQEKAQE